MFSSRQLGVRVFNDNGAGVSTFAIAKTPFVDITFLHRLIHEH